MILDGTTSALCNVQGIVGDEEYFPVISRRKHIQVKKEREKFVVSMKRDEIRYFHVIVVQ